MHVIKVQNRFYLETKSGYHAVTIGSKKTRQVTCPVCGTRYFTSQPKAQYCSNACRQKAYRRRTKKARQDHANRLARAAQDGLL
jgi:hypothetical protein